VTSVLIATEVLDTHAVAAALALQDRGHQVTRVFGEDLPQKLRASFAIGDGDDPLFDLAAPGLAQPSQRFDVVWYRRPCGPNLPAGVLHKDDETPAARENRHFLDGLWGFFGRDAFWINSMGGRQRANSKVLQLTEANRCGFSLPRTLISNEPQRIREFIRANRPGETIYKAFDGHFWDLPAGGRALNYTVKINEESLPSDALLRVAPGIFQREVAKAYELRVTYFGDHAVTAKLHSQAQASTVLDWRVVPPERIRIEPHVLPPAIDAACRRLMRRLNIVFGCFDLIVTPEGEVVFLEVNEMGQFLWIEEVNPEFAMLDTFVDFVEARSRSFMPRPKPAGERVTFRAVASRPAFDEQLRFDTAHHPSASVRVIEESAPPAENRRASPAPVLQAATA
jgi:glutathione synthase/RimK-type ligase-like ATP-grasp enzyme